MLLSAEHLKKNYTGDPLIEDASLYLGERDKIGIIGRNGVGKSTLLKMLAGVESCDGGSIVLSRDTRTAYLPQRAEMDDGNTVLQQVFADMPEQEAQLNEYEAKTILTKLGITDFDAKIGTLSGGQRKRVSLASVLVRPADILFLDEPTNHLDSEMIRWLEERLMRFQGALVVVTHDRYFLQNVVGTIGELSGGRLCLYEANYEKYLELSAQRLEMEKATERKRLALLRNEHEWIMRGARARSTKSRYRIDRYNELKDIPLIQEADTLHITAAASRLGKQLVELDDVSKHYGGKTVLEHFSYNIKRQDRIGIVGRNGAGKSTLLNLIAGTLQPDSGTVVTGQTVKIGYFTQEAKELDKNQRAFDYISEIASEVKTREGTFSATGLMEQFLFPSSLQFAPIGKLSGGELRRLYLMGVLAAAPNILLLDEPTNDLDIDTLTVLEDFLQTFPGAVIAVSHDRYFLDKMADSVFEVENGQITPYSGNYSDYYEKKKELQPPALPAPVIKEATRKPKQTKLKFSFKEQREYDTIDADIAALEADIQRCREDIDASGSDYKRLIELNETLEGLNRQLDEKMERWMYLNELADKIAAQKE